MAKPHGILATNNFTLQYVLRSYLKNNLRIISVGDVVTETLIELGIIPFLGIIDGKTKRNVVKARSYHKDNFQVIRAKNEAGVIRTSVIQLIKDLLQSRGTENYLLVIDGEEDLLTIPVVLYSSKNRDIILYGQPNAGIVIIKPNDTILWRVYEIISKMILKPC